MADTDTITPPNKPAKHHYIPEFYLKRWAGANGRLCEFKRGHDGRVRRRWTAPGGTGYKIDLYSIPELGERSAEIEKHFLGMVDHRASSALSTIENDRTGELSDELRSAWTTFLLSLIMRPPESIEAIRGAILKNYYRPRPELQDAYEKFRASENPESVDDFLTQVDPLGGFRFLLEALPSTMTHENISRFLKGMRWGAIRLPEGTTSLLTSDRPVVMSNGLKRPEGNIGVPIGPKQLFVAFTEDRGAAQFQTLPLEKVVRHINSVTVERAAKFVYSSDENQMRFISNRLGNHQEPTMGEKIVRNVAW